MQARSRRPTRRVHSGELKAKVLSQCRESGASIAAVAQANGLNASLVRKWLEGRGLKRCGLAGDGGAAGRALVAAQSAARLQFVPVDLAAAMGRDQQRALPSCSAESPEPTHIHVELRRGGASLSVRWPASQAWQCAAWLGELGAEVLK